MKKVLAIFLAFAMMFTFGVSVAGVPTGESKDVNVTFPENYQAENLKGKAAVFAVKLNKIQGKELPELTDAFIKDATGSETVDEYKAKVKERLVRRQKLNQMFGNKKYFVPQNQR